ncbi:hypothetical protein PIB19_12805 [Sphingomonas sp. 7/4-4]|uniref:hypothetical protein n=1 Tax=Sphingomonas sp. 7/4-4 TaxID=3018446 RepID=UPI0022F38B53|nr:hypothetical protein [Sphingomonas sp. 7/4-4]WBY06476.1 hypothetical protein PIB19_12805 [Sphingomonas sp. 7/4-4]
MLGMHAEPARFIDRAGRILDQDAIAQDRAGIVGRRDHVRRADHEHVGADKDQGAGGLLERELIGRRQCAFDDGHAEIGVAAGNLGTGGGARRKRQLLGGGGRARIEHDRRAGRRRRAEDARDIEPPAAIVEECLRGEREVIARRIAGDGEVVDSAIIAFIVGETGQQRRRRIARCEADRAARGHADERAGAGPHAFDRFGAEARLFDEHRWCKIFGH